jgi:nucleoid DNA-binding protein
MFDQRPRPEIAGRGFFIGLFGTNQFTGNFSTRLRNKRLRENPRQNKAFLALRWRIFTKIAVQNVENACFSRRFQPYRAASRINGAIMATQLSKSQLIEKIATTTELSKRDVKNVMDSLVDVGHKELKKNGLFLVPGFAKFVVIKKPATKARKGTNPFTGEEMMFKAKPARKIVRARPVKAAKDAVA